MAYPPSRSMNYDLVEGMSDGKYKKIIRDRGGSVDADTYNERADMLDYYYGFHEKRIKVLPDGTIARTPMYVDNPHV